MFKFLQPNEKTLNKQVEEAFQRFIDEGEVVKEELHRNRISRYIFRKGNHQIEVSWYSSGGVYEVKVNGKDSPIPDKFHQSLVDVVKNRAAKEFIKQTHEVLDILEEKDVSVNV